MADRTRKSRSDALRWVTHGFDRVSAVQKRARCKVSVQLTPSPAKQCAVRVSHGVRGLKPKGRMVVNDDV